MVRTVSKFLYCPFSCFIGRAKTPAKTSSKVIKFHGTFFLTLEMPGLRFQTGSNVFSSATKKVKTVSRTGLAGMFDIIEELWTYE